MVKSNIKTGVDKKRRYENVKGVPIGDQGVPGERDDMFHPQSTGIGDRYQHLQRYRQAVKDCQGKILDLGCGTGYGSHILFQKGKNKVYSVDISSKAIQYAQRTYPGPKYFCAGADKLPFENDYFDAVTAFEVIEHVPNPEKVLAEIRRVLKPGGSLFISTPNPRHAGRELFLLLKGKPYEPPVKNIYHNKEFYYEEFLSFLGKGQFNIISEYGQQLRLWDWNTQKLFERILPLPFLYKLQSLSGYYFPKWATTIVVRAKK